MTSALIALACAGVAYFVSGYVLAHRLRAKRFEKRAEVPFDDIFDEHFQKDGIPRDVAERLWNESAMKLRLDPRKLRPTDRFDSELSHQFSWCPFVDLNDDFYWWTIERMKRLEVKNAVFEDAQTLGAYIRAFAPLESRRA
jgi:hypothetical protein